MIFLKNSLKAGVTNLWMMPEPARVTQNHPEPTRATQESPRASKGPPAPARRQ